MNDRNSKSLTELAFYLATYVVIVKNIAARYISKGNLVNKLEENILRLEILQ